MARRSGLGKGLGALIPGEEEAEAPEGVALRQLPIESIRPNPFQPRAHFGEDSLDSLAASIREVGVLQPILVRPVVGEEGSYELIAGERRWRSARRAGLDLVPAIVQDRTTDLHSLEQALVENLHRADLNALEEAAAYQQLIDEFDLTHDQVATRVGRSRVAVTNTLRLLQLPGPVQRAIVEGRLTAGHARALLSIDDPEVLEATAARVESRGAERPGDRGAGPPDRGTARDPCEHRGRESGTRPRGRPSRRRDHRARAPARAPSRHPGAGGPQGQARKGHRRVRGSRRPRAHLPGDHRRFLDLIELIEAGSATSTGSRVLSPACG